MNTSVRTLKCAISTDHIWLNLYFKQSTLANRDHIILLHIIFCHSSRYDELRYECTFRCFYRHFFPISLCFYILLHSCLDQGRIEVEKYSLQFFIKNYISGNFDLTTKISIFVVYRGNNPEKNFHNKMKHISG